MQVTLDFDLSNLAHNLFNTTRESVSVTTSQIKINRNLDYGGKCNRTCFSRFPAWKVYAHGIEWCVATNHSKHIMADSANQFFFLKYSRHLPMIWWVSRSRYPPFDHVYSSSSPRCSNSSEQDSSEILLESWFGSVFGADIWQLRCSSQFWWDFANEKTWVVELL